MAAVHPLSRTASVSTRLLPSLAWWFAALMILGGCASGRTGNTKAGSLAAPATSEGEPRLQLDVPSDYQMRKIRGVDFDVLYYTSAKRKSSMTIYVGFHPSPRSNEPGAAAAQREAGRVGGIPVEWARWVEQGIYHSETVVRGLYKKYATDQPGGASKLLVHIFISTPGVEEASRLESVVSKMRLVTPKS